MHPRSSINTAERPADHVETPSSPPTSTASPPLPSSLAYSNPRPFRAPLIDRVTNSWRHTDDADDTETGHEVWTQQAYPWSGSKPPEWLSDIFGPGCHKSIPRRVQRWLLIYLVLLIVAFGAWNLFLQRAWIERREIQWSLDPSNKDVFGGNMMPHFPDLIKVKKLDSHLLPAIGEDRKRLIFIGDVHGCREELVELLDTVKFRSTTDHLIFTGDLISKGPDSVGVVRLARDLSASCVRGNHEDRVLTSLKNMEDEKGAALIRQANGQQHFDVEDEKHGDEKARELAKTFRPDEVEWLKGCPVILHVGHIPGMGDVKVVHGGLAAGKDLEQQDPSLVMNMRTIDTVTGVPSEEREGVCWTKPWNYRQSNLPKDHRSTVVYGHDSRRGLSIHPYSKGLDSGCVKGGKLTALVVTAALKGQPVKQELVHTQCKNWKEMLGTGGDD